MIKGAAKARNDVLVAGFIEKFIPPGLGYDKIAGMLIGDIEGYVASGLLINGATSAWANSAPEHAGFKTIEIADQIMRFASENISKARIGQVVPTVVAEVKEAVATVTVVNAPQVEPAKVLDPQEKPVKVYLSLVMQPGGCVELHVERMTSQVVYEFKEYGHRKADSFWNIAPKDLHILATLGEGATLQDLAAAILDMQTQAVEISVKLALSREEMETKEKRNGDELKAAQGRQEREMDQRNWSGQPAPTAEAETF